MRRLFRSLILVLIVVSPGPVLAVIETYEFSAPELEQRYRRLSQELRCPKCQNQNIADSNAPISQDLRRLLYEQLESGASDEAILEDMVARYGAFVRYRPAAEGVALWLWVAPVAMLLLAVGVLLQVLRRARDVTDSDLSDAERASLEQFLDRDRADP